VISGNTSCDENRTSSCPWQAWITRPCPPNSQVSPLIFCERRNTQIIYTVPQLIITGMNGQLWFFWGVVRGSVAVAMNGEDLEHFMLGASGIAWRKCDWRCNSFCCYSNNNEGVTYVVGHCPRIRFLLLYGFQSLEIS
jgi:hypothetical protein